MKDKFLVILKCVIFLAFVLFLFITAKDFNNKEINRESANLIIYGDTISQEGAKLLAKEFENNEDVKSALISGIQWDVIMNFINGKVTGNDTIMYRKLLMVSQQKSFL